jgi:methylated-DNA-[protein]-cysteine S-methyltransferase
MNKAQKLIASKVGSLYLVASEKGLQGIFWKKQRVPLLSELRETRSNRKTLQSLSQLLTQAVDQLDEYFEGKRKGFDLPLDLEGTDFQMKVWKALEKIPYGKTRSYTEIAQKINHPKAVRAVGTANAKNPICIIIPCHRVIAANGSLGGYSGTGGAQAKARLLQLENPRFRA